MAVDWGDLTRAKFERMTSRETVRDVPGVGYQAGTDSLTKKQLATLVLIHNEDVGGYGQIRHYPEYPSRSGLNMPSPSVPETLEEKGLVSVGRRKQVSRRTGRGPTGFEKKQEGGYVNAYGAKDLLDGLAERLGFKNRFDVGMAEFMREQMREMLG